MPNRRIVTALATCVVLSHALGAQASQLSVVPAHPTRGSIVLITLTQPARPGGTIVGIEGTMAGEPLHFTPAGAGIWHAIGGIPVNATAEVPAQAVVKYASGGTDIIQSTITPFQPPPTRATVRRRRLAVSSRFTQPLDSATEARIASENARAKEAGRRSHTTPRLWTAPFLRPRSSSITSRFGSGRVFNGRVTSSHLGVDFSGAIGAPVAAANRGVVALVDDFFLAGNVVYIDHGAGVLTGYFHLSKVLVAQGDSVTRGQEIGLVGATGRVTGPHLHWSARYGALTVDPLGLVALGKGW